jgi:3-(3-hydroxy-phenyl)propionate hydroxylase
MEVLDRTGVLDWIQERAKPLPTYGTGAFATPPDRLPFRRRVGSLFPQPERLDDRLGAGWAAVTRSAGSAEAWRGAGVHAVQSADDAWLQREGAEWALLRPDRFVFGCGGPDELPQAVAALRRTVGAGLVSETHEAVPA